MCRSSSQIFFQRTKVDPWVFLTGPFRLETHASAIAMKITIELELQIEEIPAATKFVEALQKLTSQVRKDCYRAHSFVLLASCHSCEHETVISPVAQKLHRPIAKLREDCAKNPTDFRCW